MAEYYYFATTLPMLVMGRECPISYDEFMRSAKRYLSKKDYESLSSLSAVSFSSNPSSRVAREWKEFHDRIEELIVQERAAVLGFEGYGKSEGEDKALRERIHSIVNDMDPLEAEKAILSMYFDFLSSRAGGSPFSTETLMIYALKLQLMERAAAFSQEKGQAEFDRLYKAIETDIFR